MLSKRYLDIIEAFAKGYYISDEGEAISPKGEKRKCKISKTGYKCFNVRINGKSCQISVHQLCAYQKYGYDAVLCENVRHLDGDKLNNKPSNIAIGSIKDNQLDIPREKRLARCNSIRKYNKEEVRAFHAQTKSYKQTMQHFGISAKGTLWFILNK